MALDRILLHLDPNGDPSGDPSSDRGRSGDDDARRVRRAVDPADVYALEADGGDTLVRLRGKEFCATFALKHSGCRNGAHLQCPHS